MISHMKMTWAGPKKKERKKETDKLSLSRGERWYFSHTWALELIW